MAISSAIEGKDWQGLVALFRTNDLSVEIVLCMGANWREHPENKTIPSLIESGRALQQFGIAKRNVLHFVAMLGDAHLLDALIFHLDPTDMVALCKTEDQDGLTPQDMVVRIIRLHKDGKIDEIIENFYWDEDWDEEQDSEQDWIDGVKEVGMGIRNFMYPDDMPSGDSYTISRNKF